MRVTISSSWLLVNIEENSAHAKMIRAFIEQNFKRVINLQDTIIVFNEESEIRKKKQLLFWIGNVYKKLNDKTLQSFIEKITKSEDIPIKVKFTKNMDQIATGLILVIKKSYLANDSVMIAHQDILILKHFLRLFFKDFNIQDSNDGHFVLHTTTIYSIKKLKELLSRQKILNFQVNFKYDLFVKKLLESIDYKEREFNKNSSKITQIDTEIQEAFNFLKSSIDDEFAVVKKRYLILAKKYHPDSVFDSVELTEQYTRIFQKIQDAFNIIKSYYSNK